MPQKSMIRHAADHTLKLKNHQQDTSLTNEPNKIGNDKAGLKVINHSINLQLQK
jgi:hypothetical protein